MATTISQAAASDLTLEWTQGDPVALEWTVTAVDWTGTYKAEVRRSADSDASQLLGELTIVAALDGADTDFTATMSAANSANVPAGTWVWDVQETGPGLTRLSGRVIVQPGVTVV